MGRCGDKVIGRHKAMGGHGERVMGRKRNRRWGDRGIRR